MNPRFTPNRKGIERLRDMIKALEVTPLDMAGPVRVELDKVHVKQMNRIFTTQGRAGAGGKWPELNLRYKARKAKVFGGRKKILQLSGDMKNKFTKPGHSDHIAKYDRKSATRGAFQFGARSAVAAAHRKGNPLLAGKQSASARRVFGGRAPRLPVRDMISKTAGQVLEIQRAFKNWYIKKRVPQVFRHFNPRLRASNPGRGR